MERNNLKKVVVVRSYFGKPSNDTGENIEEIERIIQDKVHLSAYISRWADNETEFEKKQMDDFLDGNTNFLEIRETLHDWDDPNRYTFTIYTQDELKSLFNEDHNKNKNKFEELFSCSYES